MVQCVSVEPVSGQWMASGSNDCTMRLWEVVTGRCEEVVTLQTPPTSLEFCPNPSRTLLAVTWYVTCVQWRIDIIAYIEPVLVCLCVVYSHALISMYSVSKVVCFF